MQLFSNRVINRDLIFNRTEALKIRLHNIALCDLALHGIASHDMTSYDKFLLRCIYCMRLQCFFDNYVLSFSILLFLLTGVIVYL